MKGDALRVRFGFSGCIINSLFSFLLQYYFLMAIKQPTFACYWRVWIMCVGSFSFVPSLDFIFVGSLVQNECYLRKVRERFVSQARDATYGTFKVGHLLVSRASGGHGAWGMSPKCRSGHIWGKQIVRRRLLGFSSSLSWFQASYLALPKAFDWKNPTSNLVLFSPRRFLFKVAKTTWIDERVLAGRLQAVVGRERRRKEWGVYLRQQMVLPCKLSPIIEFREEADIENQRVAC